MKKDYQIRLEVLSTLLIIWAVARSLFGGYNMFQISILEGYSDFKTMFMTSMFWVLIRTFLLFICGIFGWLVIKRKIKSTYAIGIAAAYI